MNSSKSLTPSQGAGTRLARDTCAKPIFSAIVRTEIPQQESREIRARSSNSDGEEADDDKTTQAKTREYPPQKAVKHKAEKKREETGPNRRKMEKRKKTDERKSLIELLQDQQEMMMKAEERDRLAMQELMKFEMEAEKRHQDFTLAALKGLGNIFNKKD